MEGLNTISAWGNDQINIAVGTIIGIVQHGNITSDLIVTNCTSAIDATFNNGESQLVIYRDSLSNAEYHNFDGGITVKIYAL